MAFGELFDFAHVFASEVVSINKRRKQLERPLVELEPEPLETSDGSRPLRPKEDTPVVGLALSGGGIRSAAFCLGVLQALYEARVLKRVDYLSTVSGGGYIGASLSAGMTATQGHFPFKSGLSEDETPSVQHIRDYSNYLFPEGVGDFLRNASIYVRGLIANGLLVLPFLLIGAALTIFSNPDKDQLFVPNLLGWKIPENIFSFNHFVASAYIAIFLFFVAVVWGIVRSNRRHRGMSEVTDRTARFVGFVVLIFLVTVFCELQPYILDALFKQGNNHFLQGLIAWIKGIVIALSPLAVIVSFAAQKFGEVAKSALESERVRDQAFGYAAKAAIYLAAAILPILLWVFYLQLSYWGICLDANCANYEAPSWLQSLARNFPGALTRSLRGENTHVIAELYVVVAVICLVIMLFLRPNANSLHPLYRDRLSKAFLFEPEKIFRHNPANGGQLQPLVMKLSDLSDKDAPYHLINTALNVQGSKVVNRRGRNADFFLFSRNFVGSKTTDYVATPDMESVMYGFDLGAAMAASGAAVSSNMGAATLRPLTPTLALLNIRLGYWLRNPRRVVKRGGWNKLANFYFLAEMFGMLNERRKSVYVTDGGHIENLGIYELLRRRCKVIIAVDSEADPQMAFGSFNVLERYALIDLGVRIDLPWQQISAVTKETGEKIDKDGDAPKLHGPHVAIGEIGYPGGRKGILIYIKSSLSGDENDYVFHYKKRFSAFPHETTLDQLFSEEQFEAYRALGFHSAWRFFDRRDHFAHLNESETPCMRENLKYLDELFPLTANDDPCWPRTHSTWVSWLTEGGELLKDQTRGVAERSARA